MGKAGTWVLILVSIGLVAAGSTGQLICAGIWLCGFGWLIWASWKEQEEKERHAEISRRAPRM